VRKPDLAWDGRNPVFLQALRRKRAHVEIHEPSGFLTRPSTFPPLLPMANDFDKRQMQLLHYKDGGGEIMEEEVAGRKER